MVRTLRGRATAVGVLLVAACLVAAIGIAAAREVGRDARDRARRETRERMRTQVDAAAARLGGLLRESRPAGLIEFPFPVQVLEARYVRRVTLEGAAVFAEAERQEFVAGDPDGALALYRRRLAEGLSPSQRAKGLRNVARLLRANGEAREADEVLERAVALPGVDDEPALLVAYDQATGTSDEGLRAELRAALEQGEYDGVAPRERRILHHRLGGSDDALLGLVALEGLLESASPADSLLALPGDRVAWLLAREALDYRFAVAEEAAVLAALLPEVASGRWIRVAAGGMELPSPPFPSTRLGPSRATLAAHDAAAASRRWGLLGPALAVAFGLLLGGLYVGLEGRRQRALADQRDALLLSATHELGTPIANIRLYAETLAAHGRDDPDSLGRFTKVIESEALRLQERVAEMLDVAAGRRVLPPDPHGFDAARVLVGLVEAHRQRHPETVIDLEVPAAGLPHARGTAALFARVVEAVLDNAQKFGGEGPVRVALFASGPKLELRVDDEGPGIPARDRGRVFEPFARLARDVDASVPGTGLGLALARRCVEVCGGRIRAERAPGGGTRIRVTLPVAKEGTPSCRAS